MATLSESVLAIRRLLKDTSNDANLQLLTDEEIELGVNGALTRYNKDHPREAIADITGDGGSYYLVSTSLTLWVRGSSAISGIDYDAANRISSDEEPYQLEPEDWNVYKSATDTEYLRLVGYAPSASETIRVTYTIPHTHDESTDTIYAQDLNPFRWLCASICCEMLATKRAGTSDSTINASAVAYSNKQRNFADEADRWWAKYAQHMGIDPEGGPQAAAGMVDWDKPGVYGRDYVYHGRRTR